MKMTKRIAIAGAFIALACGAIPAAAAVPGYIAQAVADPGRPSEDTGRDAARHPGDLMAFAGLKPGDKVADLMPGAGYFTRVFSKAVGPKGHVYAVFPKFMAGFETKEVASIEGVAADAQYGNVTMVTDPDTEFQTPEKLDLVWTSQNYHDLQFGMSHDQIIAYDKMILSSLKPGGVFLVIDHVAAPGTGWTVARSLHRIDPEAIKADMAAAGFVLEAHSDLLRNPADPHTALVFDASIRGHTDQAVFKFRRPR